MLNEELLTVLIVSGGGFQGQALVEGLRESDSVRIVLADSAPLTATQYLVDSVHQVPPVASSPRAFVDSLVALCAREDVSVVLPATEIELSALAEHRQRIESRGCEVMVCEPELLKKLCHKGLPSQFANEEGLSTLPSLKATSPGLSFPLLAKPVLGWGGQKHVKLANREELEAFASSNSLEEFVLQPFLDDFTEFSVDFAIRSPDSRTPCLVRTRTCTTGGFANVSDATYNPDVLDLAERFAAIIAQRGGRGIFNIQILQSLEHLVLSDVNCRIGTSAVFGLGREINLPLYLCDRQPTHRSNAGAQPTRMVRFLAQRWMDSAARISVKAIAFDLDDTLIDQKRWILQKLEHVADAHAALLPSRTLFLRAALRILEEQSRSHLFDHIAEEFQLGESTRQLLIESYRSFVPSRAPLFADVRATLAELRRRGFRLGLLTDNPPSSQKSKIECAGIEACFNALVFARDSGAEKPGAGAFHMLCEQLETDPKDVAMVGDNLYRDVLGALDAGFGQGFLVCRRGTFHNPNQALLRKVLSTEEREKLRVLESLRELHWYLVASGEVK